MKIDSSTNHHLSVARWMSGHNFKDTNQTSCLATSLNSYDIIEFKQYEVMHSEPPIPTEKDSVQQLKLLSRGLSHKERMIQNRVATIYQYYANISFSENQGRIDLRI